MMRRPVLLAAAVLLVVLCNLRPGFSICVGGETAGGAFSPRELKAAALAAKAAAEEILPCAAVLPEPELRCSLSLKKPQGDGAAAVDLILRHTPEVCKASLVTVDGTRLGFVADAEAFESELSRFILGQRPTWASSGGISGSLSFTRLYTRTQRLTPVSDMLLLVSGAAPVMYTDGQGYVSWA